MDKIQYEFVDCMRTLLSRQELLFNTQLKLISSRTERTLFFIDSTINIVTEFFKYDHPSFEMYNIKIFTEDICYFKTKHNIPVSATCYNCFLVNTDFSSQELLENDMRFRHIIGTMPTLSPYLFIQIMWNLKCEDLLVESLAHLPLDLCIQILETMIEHINELKFSRARRLAFLLIYQVYCKCLWLHLGILSEANVTTCINQLIRYFDTLLNFLNFKCALDFRKKYSREIQHGDLVKNLLYYVKKCMHSRIESYWENRNLAELFTLTYRNFNKHTNYYHMFPANDVKSIIMKLDRKLVTLFLYQIRKVKSLEYIIWGKIKDYENPAISLQRAIVMECHYLKEFIKQNDFLVTNKQLFIHLKRLIGPRKSEESILTLEELYYEIANNRRYEFYNIKELIKRYKEWDLSTLDFINEKIELFRDYDIFVILLEYLHYKFTYLRTETEKYRVYVSVLKILIQLEVKDLDSVIQIYVERHFDDNPLEYLYNERCFIEFIENFSFNENNDFSRTEKLRTILIFILLNPKEVLNKLVKHEINTETDIFNSILFQLPPVQSYYRLRRGQNNLLMYILKDILFQQRIALSQRFITFLEDALNFQITTAYDIIHELYITYLAGSYLETTTIDVILQHMYRILVREFLAPDFVRLITALLKTSSLLRRCHKIFPKHKVHEKIDRISSIVRYLQSHEKWVDEYRNIIYLSGVEPLEMNKLRPVNTLKMIQEYEKRCFVVYQQLLWDPRCPPKLRNYVQSFKLDRETFIRHMILHSCEKEFLFFGCHLMFSFCYHLGWARNSIAYLNVMRISVETLQIVLMYVAKFSGNTFTTILLVMVEFTKIVERNAFDNRTKVRPSLTIRRYLLKTLFSMTHTVNRTPYSSRYLIMLNYVQKENLFLPSNEYYDKIKNWINKYYYDDENVTIPLGDCTCDKSFYCKYHNPFIENKIAAMYNAYLFTCECIRLPITLPIIGIHRCFERLLRNLCPE